MAPAFIPPKKCLTAFLKPRLGHAYRIKLNKGWLQWRSPDFHRASFENSTTRSPHRAISIALIPLLYFRKLFAVIEC